MTDEYLTGIMDHNHSELAEVGYTYTPQEQAARDELMRLIKAEQLAFLERVEPLWQQLSHIHGTPHFIIRTSPR